MGCVVSTELQELRAAVEVLRKQNESILAKLDASPPRTAITSQPSTTHTKEPIKPTAKPATSGPLVDKSSGLKVQVMISLNVGTMLDVAKRFQEYFEARGVGVWICVEMEGGEDFRDSIVDAVDSCKVFLPLINTAWATSAECEAEFNYAYRKNLTSKAKTRIPVILPVCFPDLDWNAHRHVRLLLASTNALVYNAAEEDKLLAALSLSMKRCGVEFAANSMQHWEPTEVCSWLQTILLQPIREGHVDGAKLMKMSDDDFIQKLGFSKNHVERVRKQLAPIEGDDAPEENPKDKFEGMYKIIARTINDNDGNVTKSNEFLLVLSEGGISSSGCVWNQGTLHNNYDGVTCVWQGDYDRDTGAFSFLAQYSNKTHERYAGVLTCEGNLTFMIQAKYAWWGYGRQSYGSFDAVMLRLDAAGQAQAVAALEDMLEKGEDRLHALSGLGAPVSWDSIDGGLKAKYLEKRSAAMKLTGFVGYPATSTKWPVGKTLPVHFQRPNGVNHEKDWIGLAAKGSDTCWDEADDAWFRVWDNRVEHGVVFYPDLLPPKPGQYEVIYVSSKKVVARHPIEFV